MYFFADNQKRLLKFNATLFNFASAFQYLNSKMVEDKPAENTSSKSALKKEAKKAEKAAKKAEHKQTTSGSQEIVKEEGKNTLSLK